MGKYLISLVFVWILPSLPLAAGNDTYLVLSVEGKPLTSRPYSKDGISLKVGDFIPSNWMIYGDSPSQVNVLCRSGQFKKINRNQTASEVCHSSEEILTSDLIRYRSDDNTQVPKIIRPTSKKAINFFPIRWRYQSQVDVYIKDLKNNSIEKISPKRGEKEINISNVNLNIKPGNRYSINICRTGSTFICSNSNDELKVFIASTLDAKKVTNIKNILTDEIFSIDERLVETTVLMLNGFYDDALDHAIKLDNGLNKDFIEAKIYSSKLWFEDANLRYKTILNDSESHDFRL